MYHNNNFTTPQYKSKNASQDKACKAFLKEVYENKEY